MEASLEELDALAHLLVLVDLEVLDQWREVLDANFPDSPYFVRIEILERFINFVEVNFVVEVLRNGDQSWQQKFLDFEQHTVADL